MNQVERTKFLLFTKGELRRLYALYGAEFSLTGIRCMKWIYREIRNEIYLHEVARVERLKGMGKIAPKEAVARKAKLRKQYTR